jgi:hypothetical protein
MSSPTSPDPDPDAPEPDSSRPVPAGGNDGAPEPPEPPEASGFPPPGDEEDDSAAYLGELMAAVSAGEELTAADISGAGFGGDGTAQQLIPGPVLATLVHAATTDEKILATLSDDDLAGVIAAVRRVGSFAAWAELTAIREYATRPGTRRPAPAPGAAPAPAPGAPAGPASRPRGVDGRDPNAAVAGLPGAPKIREFAADALAPDLMGMTWQAAEGQIIYACTVAARLPVTFAALRAGKIHPVHLRIAEDETTYLDEKFLAEGSFAGVLRLPIRHSSPPAAKSEIAGACPLVR